MSRWPPRPRLGRAFYEAHGLGNDYLVFAQGDAWTASPEAVARVCDPHRGVGSDGLVAVLADEGDGVVRARMFNPDGGEFERSGNGLRVLASYLARAGRPAPYDVSVGGGRVRVRVHGARDGVYDVSVEMGRAAIGPEAVGLDPSALDARGRLAGPGGAPLTVVPISVGNPHLVVLETEVSAAQLARIGPELVAHPALAEGANVQLAERTAEGVCRALVWERGVGPTAASGTSACAVAAALVSTARAGLGRMRVEMPGGALDVDVGEGLELTLRGPVEEICEGTLGAPLLGR